MGEVEKVIQRCSLANNRSGNWILASFSLRYHLLSIRHFQELRHIHRGRVLQTERQHHYRHQDYHQMARQEKHCTMVSGPSLILPVLLLPVAIFQLTILLRRLNTPLPKTSAIPFDQSLLPRARLSTRAIFQALANIYPSEPLRCRPDLQRFADLCQGERGARQTSFLPILASPLRHYHHYATSISIHAIRTFSIVG